MTLPQQVRKGSTDILTTVYDATGRKWKKASTVEILDEYNQPSGDTYTEARVYVNGVEFSGEGTGASQIASINASSNGRVAYNYDTSTGAPAGSRVEYYHTDHLGNVRLAFSDLDGDGAITVQDIYDSTNEITQERHYYPYGLTHTGAWFATVSPEDAYRFNQKELDEATGLYDYGARYYDPAIAKFPSIDRFAEKFASQSPYVYAANDPIKFIDVNGDSIWIKNGKNNYLYDGGNLYQNGSLYTGKVSGFLKQAKNALDAIGSVPSGAALLNDLGVTSGFNFVLQKSSKNQFDPDNTSRSNFAIVSPAHAALAGTGGTVLFNPSSTTSGPNQNGKTIRPSFIGLAHELGHANMARQGIADLALFAPGHADAALRTVTRDEFNAAHTENQIRSEYNLPLREWYSTDSSGAGFMRFLVPGTSIRAGTAYDYRVSNPTVINYTGKYSGR